MIKSSEHYLSKAAELAERAEQQTHSREAMAALTALGQLNLNLAKTLAEREAAGLEPVATPEPAAFLDAHDQLWEQLPSGAYHCKATGATAWYEAAQSMFGPLRPAEVSR